MSIYGYTDDDEFVPGALTLISKLDISDPLHFHLNDSSALTVISVKLKCTKNYQVWSCAMLLALEGENKTGFIDGTCMRFNTDEIFSKRAKLVWDKLKETYDKVDGSMTFNLHHKINSLSQNGSSIADYYHRSNILSRDVLPDVRNAYVIISSEESHRVVPQTSGNPARPSNVARPSTFGNRRPVEKNGSNKNKGAQNFHKRFVNNNSVGSSFSSSSDEQISKLISLIKENSSNTVGKGVHANMAAGLIVDSGANQHLTYSDKFLVNVIDISKFGIKVSHSNGTELLTTKVGNMVLTKDITLYDVLVVLEYCVSLMSVGNKLIVAFDESHCYVLPQGLREMKCLGIGKQKDSLYYFDETQDNNLVFEKTRPFCNLTKDLWHCGLGHPSDQVMSALKNGIVVEKTNGVN
ncbi:ribonuclease H-like domain-containing protein [Tanacetum coccineum]